MEHYNCYPSYTQSRWPLDTIAEVRSPTISQFNESSKADVPNRSSSLSKEAFPFLEQDPYEAHQVVQNGLHYAGTWSNASSHDSLALPEPRSPHRHRHKRSISTSSSACLPRCGSSCSAPRSRSTSSSRGGTPSHARTKSWRVSMLLDPDSGAAYRRRLSRTLNHILDLAFAIPDIDSQLIGEVLQTLRDLDLEREERCQTFGGPGAGECHLSCPYCCEPFENDLCPYGCATSHVFYEDDYTIFRREGRRCHDSVSSTRCMTDIPCSRSRPVMSRTTSKESMTSSTCARPALPRCGSNNSLYGVHSRPGSRGHSRDNSGNTGYSSKSSSFSRPFTQQQRTPPITPPRWQQHRRHWNSNSGHNKLPSIQTMSSFSLPTPSSSISVQTPHQSPRARSQSIDDNGEWTDSDGEFDFDVSDYEVCEVEPVRFVSPQKSPTIKHVRRGRELSAHKMKRMSRKMVTRDSLYFGQAL